MKAKRHRWSARLRNPEYVGANRCSICTVANLLLVGGLVVLVGAVSVPIALVVGGISLGLLAFRGYVIPGTPILAEWYLLPLVRRWSGNESTVQTSGRDAFDVASFLLRTGVLTESGTDVSISPTFENELLRAIEAIDGPTLLESAGEFFEVAPDRVTFEARPDRWTVLIDDSPVGYWESRAAFLTDLAGQAALASWSEEWDRFTGDERGRLLAGIRACLRTCPVCGGTIELDTTLTTSCCEEHTVVTSTCDGCSSRLFEFEAAALETVG